MNTSISDPPAPETPQDSRDATDFWSIYLTLMGAYIVLSCLCCAKEMLYNPYRDKREELRRQQSREALLQEQITKQYETTHNSSIIPYNMLESTDSGKTSASTKQTGNNQGALNYTSISAQEEGGGNNVSLLSQLAEKERQKNEEKESMVSIAAEEEQEQARQVSGSNKTPHLNRMFSLNSEKQSKGFKGLNDPFQV
ncbi:hypothetical protein FGO68_gene10627 [Halteria grandinella]|uniref:Transmembrane protein n=1 Tax=Halteria grandinella TaxID=5974 RepID=A0A8J8P5G9_HALGN|nr:hypothetical protein FGO68_gene10627 [Halteria grandinella]